jgi:HD superfamily phosphodiesterase
MMLLAAPVLGAPALGARAAPAAPAAAASTDWHTTVRHFAAEHFKNPAWGFSHSQRDYALARELAASDHVVLDDDVLYAAAYLHDMAAFPPWANAKLDHSDIGAEKVDTLLKDTGFPMAKIDAVRGAIRTHMFYRDPQQPEALYLHDADALDWLGAIGVARIIALVDPNGSEPTGPKAINMIEDNLAAVPPKVFSPAGKVLLPIRRAETETFLKELRSESDDLKTL